MNYLLLVCLGIIWGSSYMFIRIAVAEVPAITLVAARLILGNTEQVLHVAGCK